MSIVERVDSINTRQERIDELANDVDEIEERRRKAERKNDALRSLKSELVAFQSDYKTVSKWQSLADKMEVQYKSEALEKIEAGIERDLRQFTKKDFEEFADAEEIRELERGFSTRHNKLDERQQDIQQSIESRCGEFLDELATKRTVLRIPDIGSDDDEKTIEEFQSFLQKHKNGNLGKKPAARYAELAAAYEDVEISFGGVQDEYNIGDESMAELKKLLKNKRVTLAEIDETVLRDLKNLSEFSQLLTIQFQEDN
ncbi:hypothetical protein [Salinibaculum rarum]|uniref:hypothetical protein n=1 Tax=Salinibaculum rarum TaxID=3058903 RepID=UPI00265DB79B|nr:hypothetical protein [Salinibaculum sp. KK48]